MISAYIEKDEYIKSLEERIEKLENILEHLFVRKRLISGRSPKTFRNPFARIPAR